MQLPNFVVIGAPKCGTTSLYYYLKQHPDIYLPERKELHYFSYDYMKDQMNGPGDKDALSYICRTPEEYERRYRNARKERAAGDISPSYFYFSQVSERIRDELVEPKILVMVRNPIEKAYSQYMHLIRDNRETLGFYDGLMAEKERIKLGWSALWRYAESSLYAERIKKYISVFGESQVKIVLFESLAASPEAIMRDVFEFLTVDASFRPKTEKIYHRSGPPKSRRLADFLNKPNIMTRLARKLVPETIRTPLRQTLSDLNTGKKEKMDDRSQAYLRDYFWSDVKEMEKLIGKELDWLT